MYIFFKGNGEVIEHFYSTRYFFTYCLLYNRGVYFHLPLSFIVYEPVLAVRSHTRDSQTSRTAIVFCGSGVHRRHRRRAILAHYALLTDVSGITIDSLL